jgi:hypothetical protein
MKLAMEHLADQTLADPVDGSGQDRGILPVVNREGDALLLAGQLLDPPKLFACSYERLLAEHVDSLAQRVNHEFGVGWRRCAYVDEIKGFTGEQLLRRSIDADTGQNLLSPSSPLRRRLAHCLKVNPALLEPAGQVPPLGHVTEPDDGSAQASGSFCLLHLKIEKRAVRNPRFASILHDSQGKSSSL